MVLSLKMYLWEGGMESSAIPVVWDHPPPGKPSRNRFPELLAASGSSWERLGGSGIDSQSSQDASRRPKTSFLEDFWKMLEDFGMFFGS